MGQDNSDRLRGVKTDSFWHNTDAKLRYNKGNAVDRFRA
jgi:hypothetical protein